MSWFTAALIRYIAGYGLLVPAFGGQSCPAFLFVLVVFVLSIPLMAVSGLGVTLARRLAPPRRGQTDFYAALAILLGWLALGFLIWPHQREFYALCGSAPAATS